MHHLTQSTQNHFHQESTFQEGTPKNREKSTGVNIQDTCFVYLARVLKSGAQYTADNHVLINWKLRQKKTFTELNKK